MPEMYESGRIHPDVRIGHVHLRVADVDRAVVFYRDVLGIALNAYGPDLGVSGPRSSPPGATTTSV